MRASRLEYSQLPRRIQAPECRAKTRGHGNAFLRVKENRRAALQADREAPRVRVLLAPQVAHVDAQQIGIRFETKFGTA